MSYSISRSTRNRELFVLVSGDVESKMEFPANEGAKHWANAARFTKWVKRNVVSNSKRNKEALMDDIAQQQAEFYKDQIF